MSHDPARSILLASLACSAHSPNRHEEIVLAQTSHPTPPTPTPIALPPHFPIEWDDPALAALPWMQDRQHAPQPITPMTGWFQQELFAGGFNRAAEAYEAPVRAAARRINGYYYVSFHPSVPPEAMEQQEERAIAKLQPAVATLQEAWDSTYLPEIQEHLGAWAEFDLQSATLEQVVTHLDETTDRYLRLWEIHFLLAFPFLMGPSLFQDLYSDLFEPDSPLEAYRLLQGFGNMSLEADSALRALATHAAADESLRELVEQPWSAEHRERLNAAPSGPAFLAALDEFLGQYGRRSDTVIELADPSWIEDPSIVLNTIRGYLRQPGLDPAKEHQALAEQREAAIASARTEIAAYPAEVQHQFETLLQAGQAGSRIQEDHNFWIDQQSLHYARQVVMEIGRRLMATGAFREAADAMYLTVPELKAAAAEPTRSQAEIVAERRQELEHWAGVQAPPAVGTDYGPPPDNPFTRMIARMFGGPPPAPSADNPDGVRGNPGSPGTARGTARVVRVLSDSGRLEPGDVLVTPTTSPPWTPLFATVVAVVADTGGPLSHCAIVAREYGIPAVVGTGRATAVIPDGATVEVNGDTGDVRIVS